MGIIRVIFELFVLYLLYKLVFDFIIPVYKTSKQVSQKMSEMQSRMNEQMKEQRSAAPQNDKTVKPSREDYIEFEEVK
jgi:sortase (surface protein transpeptidase)